MLIRISVQIQSFNFICLYYTCDVPQDFLLLLTMGNLIYFVAATMADFTSYRVSSAFTGSSDLAFLPD